MAVKHIVHPTTRQKLFFGRRRPDQEMFAAMYAGKHPRIRLFRDFAASPIVPLPGTPLNWDWTPAASAALAQPLGNDTAGCCAEAAAFHTAGILTANAGAPFVPTTGQSLGLYTSITGFNPSAQLVNGVNPTDNGTDEITLFNWWENKGLLPDGSHKISGVLLLDSANPVELRSAAYLFENLLFAGELPDAWITPFPSASGFVWPVAGAPDPDNGHMFVGGGTVVGGVKIDTWGLLGTLTYPAIADVFSQANNGAVYVVLSQDLINSAMSKAPVGFDWDQLLAKFTGAGGGPEQATQ